MNKKEHTQEAEKMKEEIIKQFQNNMLQALSGVTLGELLGMIHQIIGDDSGNHRRRMDIRWK